MAGGAEITAERLIRSLREEQDAEGVRASLSSLGSQDVEALVQLCRRLISRSEKAVLHAEDLLAVLLTSPCTNCSAVDLCLELVSTGELRGRTAVFCVSEIRQALTEEMRVKAALGASRPSAATPLGSGLHARGALRGLLDKAIGLLTCSENSKLGPENTERLGQLDLILDTLTPLLILAYHVDDCHGYLDGACDEGGGEEEGGAQPLARSTIRRLLSSPWPAPLTLQLLNACHDLAALLEDDDWGLVQRRVRENLPHCHAADLPGLARMCLTLAEHASSTQVAWIQVLRLIFRCLPSSAAGTAELVMEQCIKQSLAVVEGVLADLEASLHRQDTTEPVGEEGEQDEEGGEEAGVLALAWQDGPLQLLLMRAATAWPLQAVLETRPEGRRASTSPRHLSALLLSMLCRLASDDPSLDDLPFPPTSCASSSSCAEKPSPAANAGPLSTVVLVERMALLVTRMLTQDHAPRLSLGRVVFQRGSQLLSLCMQWMVDAEALCADVRRRGQGQAGGLRAEELRQLCVLVVCGVYGELPEAQGTTLSTLLSAIVEHSTAEALAATPGAESGGGAARRALGGYVQALEAITSTWPNSLRQHSHVFQQLLVQLPTLPARLSSHVLSAVSPLATTCPAFLDALLAAVRKHIAHSDSHSRSFATTALTTLLAQDSGLLALADRCQEVSSVFQSLLSLSLPLQLKSRLYRAVTRTLPLRASPTASHLHDCMARRLDRFLLPPPRRGLSPLSLYHEYTVQGSVRVTPRDDLPELLRCVLSLSAPPTTLASLLTTAILHPSSSSGPASSSQSLIRAAVGFVRQGCPMEQRHVAPLMMDGDSCPAQCDPDHVPTSEKLHLLLPLTEVLIDALLDYPDAATASQAEQDKWAHDRVLSSCLELYAVHGMLTDVAEALQVKPRDRWASLDGKERDGPCLSLRGAVYLLQLVILEGRGRLRASDEGGTLCPDCALLRRRYRLWAMHHALLTTGAELEAQANGGHWLGPEALKSQSLSLKGVLILLMDLHDLCATPLDTWQGHTADAEGPFACGHEAPASEPEHSPGPAAVAGAAKAAATDKGKGKARMGQHDGKPTRPLWLDFHASVDGRFRSLVQAQARPSRATDEALTLVRACLVQCMRCVLRRCPVDSSLGDEIFTFFDPPPPSPSPSPLLEYRGLAYLVNSLLSELCVSLGRRGLPLRLVTAYLDLFDVLFARITAPTTAIQASYSEWKAGVAEGLAAIVVGTTIAQSTVVRRFLRLAMRLGTGPRSLAMSCGLCESVLRYFSEWAKEKHADAEVITASEAKGQLMDEGDEFFRDSSGGEDDDDDHDDVERGEGHKKQRGAAEQACDLSNVIFASEVCWQAATSSLLTVWEGLLGAYEGEAGLAWSDLLAHLQRFLQPVVDGGVRRGAKGRLLASMLPSPLKLRLLAVLARLYASLRLAATRVASHLRQHSDLGEALIALDSTSQGEAGLPVAASLGLVLEYMGHGESLEGPIKAWVSAERSRGRSRSQDAGMLKRFPPLLFAIERVQVSTLRLCQQVLKHKKQTSHIESPPILWCRLLEEASRRCKPKKTPHKDKGEPGAEGTPREGEGAEEEEEEEEEDSVLPVIGRQRSKKRKRRLRSRNVVVDRWLEDEDGSDAYADLEDFIAENEIT